MFSKILNKRSSVITENLTPQIPTQLDYGEIAINYGAGAETIFIKNSDNQIISFSNDVLIMNYVIKNVK